MWNPVHHFQKCRKDILRKNEGIFLTNGGYLDPIEKNRFPKFKLKSARLDLRYVVLFTSVTFGFHIGRKDILRKNEGIFLKNGEYLDPIEKSRFPKFKLKSARLHLSYLGCR